MTLRLRAIAIVALAASLSACMGGLLGGGGKPPTTLYTLTADAADPGTMNRTVNAGQAVTIGTPLMARELRTVRVPVQLTPTDVQYVTDLQWIDTPDRLFQSLLQETVRRKTNRVVLDPRQTGLDPGLQVTGELERFGYDASTRQATVVYDASLSAAGGARTETRRFIATVPADGTARSVATGLNSAANQVASQVAQWIGNSTV
jgi:cholesterol transport system auxiliary component